jgi:predicted nucleic acid-binding protein
VNTFTVVYDACVLYPAPLRDLLVQLALHDIFAARWTDAIHEEWISGVLKSRPDIKRAALERTRSLLNSNVRDSLVTGYESLIGSLSLPDENDRHVLAAAIRCNADALITFNIRDFPQVSLEPFGIMAIHPDEFILNEIDLHEAVVCEAVKIVRSRLKNPPKTVDEYLATLERQGLTQTVAALRVFETLL